MKWLVILASIGFTIVQPELAILTVPAMLALYAEDKKGGKK